MSDEDRDVDIESEDDDLDGDEKGAGGQYQTQVSRRKVTCYRNPIVRSDPNKSRPPGRRLSDHTLLHNPPNRAEKRAHHNALERKRRDHIKDSFSGLRDSIPALHGEKVVKKASRAQILKKAADYIQSMRKKNTIHQQDIDDLKRQNHMLELQIRSLEKSRTTGGSFPGFDGGSGTETSDSESASHQQRRKKMKVVSSAAVNSSSDT